jgi:hypothetical protein
MLARLAILLAAVSVATACGGGGGEAVTTTGTNGTTDTTATTTTGTTTPEQRCLEREGTVSDLFPVARLECGREATPVETGDAIFRGNRLTTERESTLAFDLDLAPSGTARCALQEDSAAVIRPSPDIALEVLDGAVGCDVSAAATFKAPGAEIHTTGTLFSLTASGDTTTIRLYEGTIDVDSSAGGGIEQLSATGEACPTNATQAFVSRAQPAQTMAYVLDPGELQIVAIVKLRIGLVPPKTLEPVTNALAASTATVITVTEGQKQVLQDQNIVQQLPLVTVATLRERSAEQPVEAGDTVVGVGSFPALVDTFCRLRNTFRSDVRLLYTPDAFSQTATTSTETETTETSSTGTETTPP